MFDRLHVILANVDIGLRVRGESDENVIIFWEKMR
jgi:hypothetical protein